MAHKSSHRVHSATHMKRIVASPNDLAPRPRVLYVTRKGTMDFTNEDGSEELNVLVFANTQLRFQPMKITRIRGAIIYGMYG